MDRRHVVGGGLLGVTALLGGGAADAAQRGGGVEVARAIDEIRKVLERRLEGPFAELADIRHQQRLHLKASHKFPDYIEIGLSVWERLYDWHVRHQQPLDIVRRSDGRYTMTFMFTTLVLRPDQADTYVGLAYDVR